MYLVLEDIFLSKGFRDVGMCKRINAQILSFFMYFFLKLSSRYHTDSLLPSFIAQLSVSDFTKGRHTTHLSLYVVLRYKNLGFPMKTIHNLVWRYCAFSQKEQVRYLLLILRMSFQKFICCIIYRDQI